MTTPKPVQGNSNFTTFNIRHGFAEALVRGMRSSFLADQDYNHLIQCETLEDVRLNLTETDYSDAIADFNSLTPAMLQKAAVEKVGVLLELIMTSNRCLSGEHFQRSNSR
jgi:V-type H+-transporting ATPase subunit d